jgi:hypothetical protein
MRDMGWSDKAIYIADTLAKEANESKLMSRDERQARGYVSTKKPLPKTGAAG